MCLAHVPLNCSLRDLDAKLQQFTTDTFGTPHGVVDCHLFDQGDCLCSNLRFVRPCLRFALPEQSEALPMPAEHSFVTMSKASCQFCSPLASRMKRVRSAGV